jgi:4-hydroxybenzoyl-CoA thioesterase
MRVFILPLTVDFGDCDPAGLVFYPNYHRWFDRATHTMFRNVGWGFDRFRDAGFVAWPLVEVGSRFLATAFAGDELEVHSSITQWEAKTFRISHRILRGNSLIVDGFEQRFLGERPAGGKLRAVPMPDDVRQLF